MCLWCIPVLVIAEEVNSIQNHENSSQEEQKIDDFNGDNNSGDVGDLNLASNAKSAIMIEASTGKVIYKKNVDERLPMASMTKMMTLLLIMENIDKGNLKWDEMVTTSEYAASMGGSQIFLEVGEKMSVEDLVKGICIGSGNDAAVAMAERIGGTEQEFVKMMNKKVKELGLSNTNFENACGLDSDNHYSSANDMVVIAKELVKYDKILEFTGTYEDYLRKNTDNSFWLVNTNKLVRYYQGVDGLKTGYTDKSGYCITTTAIRNNLRFITVVMGEPSSSIRNSETMAMLDYGFNTYEVNTLISKEKVLSKVKVKMGVDEKVGVISKKDVNILDSKMKDKRDVIYKLELDTINAPVKKGDIVGKIKVLEGGKVIMTVDATVDRNVDKAGIVTVYFRNLLDIVKGVG